MENEACIIGEIPMDDVRLLEDNYQKELRKLLERRKIPIEDFQGKFIRLLPGKNDRTFYVMAV